MTARRVAHHNPSVRRGRNAGRSVEIRPGISVGVFDHKVQTRYSLIDKLQNRINMKSLNIINNLFNDELYNTKIAVEVCCDPCYTASIWYVLTCFEMGDEPFRLHNILIVKVVTACYSK